MPHVPILPPEEAPTIVQAVYEDFRLRMQFPSPPNFIMTQGHSPEVVQGTWDLVRNVLVSGMIPRWTKEMIFVAISIDRKCGYCVAAHIACCRMLGVNPETLASLVQNVEGLQDVRIRDIILFALKCSRDPKSLDAIDHQKLRDHGITQSETIEIISMAGLAVYANIMADATAMDADEVFTDLGSC